MIISRRQKIYQMYSVAINEITLISKCSNTELEESVLSIPPGEGQYLYLMMINVKN